MSAWNLADISEMTGLKLVNRLNEVHVIHLKHGLSECITSYGRYLTITASYEGLVFSIIPEENFQYLKNEYESLNSDLHLEWIWDDIL